jgi:UDP-N-acetylglucosamine--N-acetylmuramyl-(pentapeptide) pyrophosphoryl-undecaprenol N-acetylglucosamine transferase
LYTNVWVDTFITDMGKAYAAADIVVSRAGAMSVSEICVVKKPAIFVPYPYAAEDHQTVNAMYLVSNGAAWMVKDSEAGKELYAKMMELAKSQEIQQALITRITPLAITNADEVVATEILKYIRG